MKMFNSAVNDGTLFITTKTNRPLQGTLVNKKDGKFILGKGIVRPPLITEYGEQEDEQLVEDAAFGKSFANTDTLDFYPLNDLSDQKCTLNKQAVYFACKNPHEFIKQDTQRFNSLSAFDFMSKDAARKIKTGVPPALLIETAAVWKMIDRFAVQGVRSLAIASELVPSGVLSAVSPEDKMEQALRAIERDEYTPSFLLLSDTAKQLAKQLGCSISDLKGKYFLIHRDPSLPDGTSLVPMVMMGVASWANGSVHEGIVFHPSNRYWQNMGGDFDGDYAVVLKPTPTLFPRGPLPRTNYRVKGKKYDSGNIIDMMIQDAEDSVASLLGPTILNAMRLVERGLDSDSMRSACASVAQASVEAKKHAVNSDVVSTEAQYIMTQVMEGSFQRTYPYIVDFTNEISNTKNFEGKAELWQKLVSYLPYWEQKGTLLEQALCERIATLHQLFSDVEFFRHQKRAKLPQTMVEHAKSQASAEAAEAIKELTVTYNKTARSMQEVEYTDEEARDSHIADIRDELKGISAKFNLAITIGLIGNVKVSPLDAQFAMIGYGPARLAARFVPAEVFEVCGVKAKRLITQLIGTNWESKEYQVIDVSAIPSCASEVNAFLQGVQSVQVTVIRNSPNSTRVLLEV
jgi:hypothetical protein